VEVIVPHDALTWIDGPVAAEHPAVRWMDVGDEVRRRGLTRGSHERHHLFRAAGLAAARGDIVAMIEDDACPADDWAAQILAAHQRPDAVIGGAVENGGRGLLGWANYFCDYWRYQQPLPSGSSSWVTDGNAAYKRRELEEIRPLWERAFHEPVVHAALRARGLGMSLDAGIVVVQHRQCGSGLVLKRRLAWAWSYAAVRARGWPAWKRAAMASLSLGLPLLRIGRMVIGTIRRRRNVGRVLAALPLVCVLELLWAAGEAGAYAASGRTPRALAAEEAVAS